MDSATGEKTPAHVPIVDWFHSEILESSSDAASVALLKGYYIKNLGLKNATALKI